MTEFETALMEIRKEAMQKLWDNVLATVPYDKIPDEAIRIAKEMNLNGVKDD